MEKIPEPAVVPHVPVVVTPEEYLEALREERLALSRWRGWAQFVFLGGGPVTKTDDELRTAICEAYDAASICPRCTVV